MKANPTTVYARSETTDMVHSFYYADIESIISDQAETPREDTELHPYEKDDILVWDPHGSGRYLAAYQVVAVTEKTVQMREIEFVPMDNLKKTTLKKRQGSFVANHISILSPIGGEFVVPGKEY